MKNNIVAQLLIVILLISAGCSEEGPAGPSGPAGPTGATGATGATGSTGPAGTANVIFGPWFTPSAYTMETIFGIKHFSYTMEVPEFTQAVLDSGVVLVYAKLLGYNAAVWPTNQVGLMPITLTYIQGSTMSDTWSAYVSEGNLKIEFVNDANYYSGIATAHKFRFIIIPGGVAASEGGRVSNEESISRLQQMSYEEVVEELGIPE